MALMKNGTDLLLFVATGSETPKCIAHTNQFSIDFSTAMREVSSKSTGNLSAFMPGKMDVGISVSGMVCYDENYNADTLTSLWQNRTRVKLLNADRSGSSTYPTEVPATGSLTNWGSGSFYITSLTIAAPNQENVTFDAKFSSAELGDYIWVQG